MTLNKMKNKTYIIAEIGVNHNGSFKIAKKLVKWLKIVVQMQLNFKFLKLQTYQGKMQNLHLINLKILKKKFRNLKYLES